MKEKTAVIGAGGAIGSSVARVLARSTDVLPAIFGFVPKGLENAVKLDITDSSAIARFLDIHNPTCVVNLAAIADADLCEKRDRSVRAVNITGAENISKECNDRGLYLIHYSTDLVFDGTKGNYNENDQPNPLNYYAQTKLESEQAVLSCNEKSAILRTAIVYGKGSGNRKSFFETTLEKGKAGIPSRLYTDQFRSFLYVNDSASAITAMTHKRVSGIYHAGGNEVLSRYDFTKKLFMLMGINSDSLLPIKMDEHKTSAPRPADCSLNSDKLKNATEWNPTGMEQAVKAIIKASP